MASPRSSQIKGEHSWRLYQHLQQVRKAHENAGRPFSRQDDYTRALLTEYIRFAYRRGWSYKLIGEVLGIDPRRASRLHKRWQDENFPL